MMASNGFSAILAVLLIVVNSQELVKGKSENLFSSVRKRFILSGNSTQKKFPTGICEKRVATAAQCVNKNRQRFVSIHIF